MKSSEIQFLLKQYRISPRYAQGQNFLLDETVVHDAVAAAEITAEDTVLEIGPGFGVLTTALAEAAARVIAVEQDREIMKALHALQKHYANLTVVNEDIRTANLSALGLHDRNYKLVSNLPYSISSWVLRQFTEYPPTPTVMVVMLQQEVAERVVATPGDMSILANAVQLYADAEIIRTVSKQNFYPIPTVESALLKITQRAKPRSAEPEALMSLIKIGFSSKRKQLHNNLQSGLQLRSAEARAVLEDIGLGANIRSQELGIADWEALRIALNRKV